MIKNLYYESSVEGDIEFYHLGIKGNSAELTKTYGDVKIVVMGGMCSRMKSMALDFKKIICSEELKIDQIENLAALGERYSMYKVASVIFISHGMGNPSISIALHEITKLLHFSGVKDPIYMRVGTCGGLDLTPGTVVVSEICYSSSLRPEFELNVCGQSIKRPSVLDRKLAEQFVQLANSVDPTFNIIIGNTMCANDFYEEQARLDGALNVIDEAKKAAFLARLTKEFNIRNIEMESLYFSSFCNTLNIRGIVACMTLLNRLHGDSITLDGDQKIQLQSRFNEIILQFLKNNH